MARRANALWIALSTLTLLATGCVDNADRNTLAYQQDLYEGCASCHGERGEGSLEADAPAIAGLDQWYIKAQLRKFAKGYRGTHPKDRTGLKMLPMSRQLRNDEDLQLVASYVAALPPTYPAPALEGGNAGLGKAYFAACATCHGADGKGDIVQRAPGLIYTNDWYLVEQLKKFKADHRGADLMDVTGSTMRPWAKTLVNEQAMKDVVAHIQTLRENTDVQ